MLETPQSDVTKSDEQVQPLMQRWWSQYKANRRRIGTVAAALFAVLLAWHVVSGRNGLTSWQQKRAEDKSLAKEIEQLTQENARISQHVDRLRSDPGAIEHEARLRLRYARPNEVIYTLPDSPKSTPAQMPAK
jgi:cell division protein FtsB